MSSLLPSYVHLLNDEEMNVREAAMNSLTDAFSLFTRGSDDSEKPPKINNFRCQKAYIVLYNQKTNRRSIGKEERRSGSHLE